MRFFLAVFPLLCFLNVSCLVGSPLQEGVKVAEEKVEEWCDPLFSEYEEFKLFGKRDNKGKEGSYSERYLGRKEPLFDRTLFSIKIFYTFLEGKYEDYLLFVKEQPKEERLAWESFLSIQKELSSVIEEHPKIAPKEMKNLFTLSLLIKHLIHLESVKQKRVLCDQKDICKKVLSYSPQMFPSIQKLSPSCRALLPHVLCLSDLTAVARFEGGVSGFLAIKNNQLFQKDPLTFPIAFLIHNCFLAAREGTLEEPFSSGMYTENLYRELTAVRASCEVLKKEGETAAYEHYLKQRADWLGLGVQSAPDRILAKVGAMLGLATKEEGELIKDALFSLKQEDLSLVVEEFQRFREGEKVKASTFLARTLRNLAASESLGKDSKEQVSQAVHIGLPFVARVLKFYRNRLTKDFVDREIVLNFEKIAKIAKSAPLALVDKGFTIDNDGEVTLRK